MVTGKITMGLETDHVAETGTKIIIVIGITVGCETKTTTEMVIVTTIDQTIESVSYIYIFIYDV